MLKAACGQGGINSQSVPVVAVAEITLSVWWRFPSSIASAAARLFRMLSRGALARSWRRALVKQTAKPPHLSASGPTSKTKPFREGAVTCRWTGARAAAVCHKRCHAVCRALSQLSVTDLSVKGSFTAGCHCHICLSQALSAGGLVVAVGCHPNLSGGEGTN